MDRKGRILVVDDEELVRWSLHEALSPDGHMVKTVGSGEDALEEFSRNDYDIVILDIKLPGIDGIEVLKEMHKVNPSSLVIMITAHGGVANAVEAMKCGAHDYLQKPFEIEEVKLTVQKALEVADLRIRVGDHIEEQRESYSFGKMVGKSPKMLDVFEMAGKVAKTPRGNILILGDSGTGKGILAKAIHYQSAHADKPFVEMNCAAIPDTLMESELFGYRKGAFTDAKENKPGLIEKADGGTLFLDEIGDMGFNIQAKILKVIDEKKFTRLGETTEREVDIRIMAASNKDLKAMVEEGTFREDLYFRLDVIRLELPPLRERDDDVIQIAKHFIERYNKEMGRDVMSISPAAAEAMRRYDWPGNIRELRNSIERIMILEDTERIEYGMLPASIRGERDEAPEGPPTLEDMERDYILKVLKEEGGNISQAAKVLGISRHTIMRKLERWGIKGDDLT
jgi:two-component system response regulator AtoC